MSKVYYAGPAVEHTAGETLSGNRVVAIVDNEAFYASHDNPDHLHLVRGITVAAAMVGSQACIQIDGPMSEPGWNWTPKLPLYLSTNGNLTHTPPTTGFSQQIAVADTATRIHINPKIPIQT